MNDFEKQAQIWRQNSLASSGQMTLGQMIAACEQLEVEDDASVVFDFVYQKPLGIISWRGIYAELALEYGTPQEDMTLGDFKKLLKETLGKTFTGYKGGDYTMSEQTPVWVANYGEVGNTAVLGITATHEVIIHTGYREAF